MTPILATKKKNGLHFLIIWSVQNSATKGIQGMQAVSNLPISTGLTPAACRGFPAVKIRQKKPSADWWIWNDLHSLNSFGHIEKATFVTSASIFSETVKEMKLKFDEEIEKKLIYQDPSPFRWDFQYFCVNSSLKWRRSRLTAAKLQALSPFLVLTITGQK